MKKLTKIFGGLLALTMALTGCAGGTSGGSGSSDGASAGEASDTVKIGIIQYGSHPSLDNCREGVLKGLNNSSYSDKIEIDVQDGGFESTTCDTIAKSMVAKNYDMIFAIATPAALSAYSAAQNSDTNVIFCAVSDPVAAGLTVSFDSGTEN